MGSPISPFQLQALEKTDSLLYMIQLYAVDLVQPNQSDIPPKLQDIIQQFDSVFSPPTELPPPRQGDHSIPLLDGAQPFSLRPYRYNLAQKTEIETQIKEMLDKGWI